MTTPLDVVLGRLEARDGRPKRSGAHWVAHCPAHADSTPSLSVSVGQTGAVLLKCFAGCPIESVLNALDLRTADLFDRDQLEGEVRGSPRPTAKPTAIAYPTLEAAIRAAERRLRGKEGGRYEYLRGDHGLHGVMVRFNLTAGGKTVRPFHRAEAGWLSADPPGLWPPYRLPSLLGVHSRIYIVEGEKCVDLARALGLITTTSSHGAQAATRTDWSLLPDSCEYVILPDHDEAGAAYAATVARIIARVIRPAAQIKIMPLVEAEGNGDDIEQWLAIMRGRGMTDAQIRAELDARADVAPIFDPQPVEAPPIHPEAICLADIQPQEIRWLWPGRIASGKVNLIFGLPGVGKSLLTMDMAARVTRGLGWPPECDEHGHPGHRAAQREDPGDVLILSAEDDAADTIRPRFEAAGGDVRRAFLLNTARDSQNRPTPIRLDRDMALIRGELARVTHPRLVIVDPVTAFLGDRDSADVGEMRGLLYELQVCAQETGAAIVIVSHANKTAGTAAIHRTIGSQAFIAAVRIAWCIGQDPENADARIMSAVKSNISVLRNAWRYRIVVAPDASHPTLAWDSNPVHFTADDLLAHAEMGPQRSNTKGNEAEQWLREALISDSVPVIELQAHAKADGLAWRTIERAKERIGVVSERRGPAWVWRLSGPDESESAHRPSNQDRQPVQDRRTPDLAVLSQVPANTTASVQDRQPNGEGMHTGIGGLEMHLDGMEDGEPSQRSNGTVHPAATLREESSP